MTHEREIAGIFAGAAALLLIYLQQYAAGVGIVSAMVGFFVGEQNGKRQIQEYVSEEPA